MPLVKDVLLAFRDGRLTVGDEAVVEAFPDAKLEGIAADIGATPEALAPELAGWALWAMDRLPDPPPSPEVKAELRKLQQLFEAAENACRGLSEDARFRMTLARHDFQVVAGQLTAAAARAGGRVLGKRGPPQDVVAERLVHGLAQYYERVTGKKAGRVVDREGRGEGGPFVLFAEWCLEAIGAPEMAAPWKIRRGLRRMEELRPKQG
jgi:hypothetical protein